MSSATTSADQVVPAPRSTGPYRRALRRFLRNKGATASATVLLVLVLATIFAPFVASQDPIKQDYSFLWSPASRAHWFGTDDIGRDTFARIVYGGRVDLRAAFEVVAIVLVIAVPIGLAAGTVGGRVDFFIMRAMELIQAFPPLILAIVIAGILGQGVTNLIIAMVVVFTPGFVRLVRAQALAVSEETFIEASRSIGTPTVRIMLRRVLPNVGSALIVQTSVALGGMMLVTASLGFLGLGAPAPTPMWGAMMRKAFEVITTNPNQILPPGLTIAACVLCFNVVGDGLRDALGLGVPAATRLKRVRARLGLTSVVTASGTVSRPEPEPAAADAALLSVRELRVAFATEHGVVHVVDDVSFDVHPGEVVGLVGESGSGKTMTSQAIMRIIASPPGHIAGGSITFEGRDLLGLGSAEMRELRGDGIAMIFQDPQSSLNPAFTIGNQLVEAIRLHRRVSRGEARARARELLVQVGINDPDARLKEYPHRLSGGMRQRVMIAMALSCEPRLLIADEPTTALDVTIQAQILELLKRLVHDRDMAMIFVTHDLGVVAGICDRVVVMYAGQVVESSDVRSVFAAPKHPYTSALLDAIPSEHGAAERLVSIPGVVPPAGQMPNGCRFGPRCAHAVEACAADPVVLTRGGAHEVRCIRADELVLKAAALHGIAP